jgi:hypothetical protein
MWQRVRRAMRSAGTLASERPVQFASASFVIKYTIADLIAQSSSQPNGDEADVANHQQLDTIDTRRLTLFALFGGYYGAVNCFIFQSLAAIPWPGGRLAGAFGMTVADSMIHIPLFFMPQFYVCKGVVLSDAIPTPGELAEHIITALATYRANFVPDLKVGKLLRALLTN